MRWIGGVFAALLLLTACTGRSEVAMASDSDGGKITIYFASLGREETVEKTVRSEAEWRSILTPEQYDVTRRRGTERPYTDSCEIPKEKGLYRCVGCGTDLFGVDEKFVSGTGWPSFWDPVSEKNIRIRMDTDHGMTREEVLCARCDAHLGHVFEDGPPPTGRRYCINSVALTWTSAADSAARAIFGAGCFWGIESAFRSLPGVISTRVGYAGGTTTNPTYEEVCTDRTGHAEVVEVTYDPKRLTYERLLEAFWKIHDPTQVNRQGPDVGRQYRSVVFVANDEQERTVRSAISHLESSGRFTRPVATSIERAAAFWPAEEYHQQYYERRGLKPSCVIF